MFHQKPLLGRRLNHSHSLTKGLIGCWVMNEGSGSVQNLLSKQMTSFSGPNWITGIGGSGLKFNGSSDEIQVTSGLTSRWPGVGRHDGITIAIITDYDSADPSA